MSIKDLKESLANNTKQLDGIRASTLSMSKGIETLVKIQTADRKQKYEEARESIRDKQKQEKLTAAKVAKEKTGDKKGGGLLGDLFGGIGSIFKNLKNFSWGKWLLGLGIAAAFHKEIAQVFTYIKGKIANYWDNTLSKAFKQFADAITPEWIKGIFLGEAIGDETGPARKQTMVSKAWDGIASAAAAVWDTFKAVDTWIGKVFGMKDGKGDPEGPVAKAWKNLGDYLGKIGSAFSELMEKLQITENGEIRPGVALGGLGVLVAMFAVTGPVKLAYKIFKGIASIGTGTVKIAWKLVRAGFLAMAGMGKGLGRLATGQRGAPSGSTGGTPNAPLVMGGGNTGTQHIANPDRYTKDGKAMRFNPATGQYHMLGKDGKSIAKNAIRGRDIGRASLGAQAVSSNAVKAATTARAPMRMGIMGGAMRFIGGALTHPLVIGAAIVTGIIALVWKMSKEHGEKQDKVTRRGMENILTPEELNKTYSTARQDVTQERGYDPTGEGGFERWAKVTGRQIPDQKFIKQGRRWAINMMAQREKEYEAELKQYDQDIDDAALRIGQTLISPINKNRISNINNLMERMHPFQQAISEGAIKLAVEPHVFQRNLHNWAMDERNSGMPITMDVLKNMGVEEILTDKKITMKIGARGQRGEAKKDMKGTLTAGPLKDMFSEFNYNQPHRVRDRLEAARQNAQPRIPDMISAAGRPSGIPKVKEKVEEANRGAAAGTVIHHTNNGLIPFFVELIELAKVTATATGITAAKPDGGSAPPPAPIHLLPRNLDSKFNLVGTFTGS